MNKVAFSPDGKYIATASEDKTARICNLSTGKQLFALNHSGVVNSVTFSPDGKYVATASNDNTARLMNLFTGRSIPLNHYGRINNVMFVLMENTSQRQVTTILHAYGM